MKFWRREFSHLGAEHLCQIMHCVPERISHSHGWLLKTKLCLLQVNHHFHMQKNSQGILQFKNIAFWISWRKCSCQSQETTWHTPSIPKWLSEIICLVDFVENFAQQSGVPNNFYINKIINIWSWTIIFGQETPGGRTIILGRREYQIYIVIWAQIF